MCHYSLLRPLLLAQRWRNIGISTACSAPPLVLGLSFWACALALHCAHTRPPAVPTDALLWAGDAVDALVYAARVAQHIARLVADTPPRRFRCCAVSADEIAVLAPQTPPRCLGRRTSTCARCCCMCLDCDPKLHACVVAACVLVCWRSCAHTTGGHRLGTHRLQVNAAQVEFRQEQ